METRGSCPVTRLKFPANLSGYPKPHGLYVWLHGTTLSSCSVTFTLVTPTWLLCTPVWPPRAHLDPFICGLFSLAWRVAFLCPRGTHVPLCQVFHVQLCVWLGWNRHWSPRPAHHHPTTRNLSGSFTVSSPELLWSLGPEASSLRPVFSWCLRVLFGMGSWEFRVHRQSQLLACFLFSFLPNSTISIGKEMEKLALFLKPFYFLPGYLGIFQDDFDFADRSFQFFKIQHEVISAPFLLSKMGFLGL